MKTSVLSLQWKMRQGWVDMDAASCFPRCYLEFLIDGRPLKTELEKGERWMVDDKVSCLSLWNRDEPWKLDSEAILRLTEPQRFQSSEGRTELYICPECGDIGCGAITVAAESNQDHIFWRDFAYENWDTETGPRWDPFKHVGPFMFDRYQFEEALSQIEEVPKGMKRRHSIWQMQFNLAMKVVDLKSFLRIK